MARQAAGKDLQQFAGQPEEWPIFKKMFDTTTRDCGFFAENLSRLHRALKGKARDAVQFMLAVPDNVPEILATLQERFGRPEHVVHHLITRAQSFRTLRADDFEQLVEFSTTVRGLVQTMKLMNSTGHLRNPQLRQELVAKLPAGMRLNWGEMIANFDPEKLSLDDFSVWLCGKASAASRVTVLKTGSVSSSGGSSSNKRTRSETTLTTLSNSGSSRQQERAPFACHYCSSQHPLRSCDSFKALPLQKRREWVAEKKLCFLCFGRSHRVTDCKSRNRCSVGDCGKRHHELVHPSDRNSGGHTGQQESVNSHTAQRTRVALRVVPVSLSVSNGHSVKTHALLDEGSTVSIVEEKLARELGATGPVDPLHLSWTGNHSQHHANSCRVNLCISPRDGGEQFDLQNVRTVANLSLPKQFVNQQKLARQWSHLTHIDLPSLAEVTPMLLIGQDHYHLTAPREILEGPPNAPVATNTKLGWVLHGNTGQCQRVDSEVSFVSWSADDELTLGSRWMTGPEYLQSPPQRWPPDVKPAVADSSPSIELKGEFVATAVSSECVRNAALPDPSRFSSWMRLVRATAWVLRFVKILKHRALRTSAPPPEELVPEELESAERLWWQQVQADCFPAEVRSIESGKPVDKDSRLSHLSLVLTDGVVRHHSRLVNSSDLPDMVKQPVVLDPSHPFTRLLIAWYHVASCHQGQERVCNELRQRYLILGLRRAVRSSWNTCQKCSNDRAQPAAPEMAPLPSTRLTPFVRAFTVVGMDYFGPMTVAVGRRHEKRYGVLFTCLSTRAVHLEVAHALTTDACIMAIRRMIGRRGRPHQIWSDNGTNLRGAERELRESLNDLDQDQLTTDLALLRIEWSFNPPSAPHMGGAWERLVRSVKSTLRVILHERAPKDEVLLTLMIEAESLVNSRPLTHVPVDPNDPESLTPNHFLLGTSSSVQPPGEFTERDLCCRKQWRLSQILADMFWRRWLKEYAPSLATRKNWRGVGQEISVGDVVIIVDDQLPRGSWPRGLVTAVFPGRDGKVRVADVKTATGTFRRPVVKLCRLNVLSSLA